MTNIKNAIANPLLVLREEFDDWAILFDPDTGNAHGLNPVSVFIWKCLDGNHSINQIHAKLGENCDDMPDDAARYIEEFIAELVGKGYAGYQTQ